ncbi:nuclear transport factor 2 family protein [Sphingomonas rhizophila]|uniref:Nuclear transport factor 2 family protein n=1 Tax=Sphingomonas rhizophila TaxID=2071607 RepID=A0A7G9S8T9_9SPHN|nr:nuclear transport factor 2 family protein [Sphingomonas rhizophila]QNN64264.1 nuclear transport factor 2 family protein [Sphingomonas rhizophila]
MRSILLGALVVLAPVAAPPAMAQPAPAAAIDAAATDAAAISAAVKDVYAVISGPAGQPRDWARMRSLFAPDARMTAITPKGLSGGTLEDYIAKSGPILVKVGFTERELAHRIEQYGDIAHVWSSYEGTSTDGKLKVRGINSFQLARLGGQWKVQSIFWQPEHSGLPLPADMAQPAK